MDRATFEHFVSGVINGMPGYEYEIHDQIAQGDLVANRITWRASIPPTSPASRHPAGRSNYAGSTCSG